MNIGKLDRRLELRHRVQTLDTSSGQTVDSWPKKYAKPWGSRRDDDGSESVAGQQVNGYTTSVFRIRYRKGVLMTDRVIDGDLAYNIHAIAEIGRREGLEITATAVRP